MNKVHSIFLTIFLLLNFDLHAEEKPGVQTSSPVELIMKDQAVLQRIFTIYDEIITLVDIERHFNGQILKDTATIFGQFGEKYEQKMEESYVYPKFKSTKYDDLVNTFLVQQQVGRIITQYLITHANEDYLKIRENRRKIGDALKSFVKMYRLLLAREQTVILPAFKELISQKEYEDLENTLKIQQNRVMGENGYQKVIEDLTTIEQTLGIYDLKKATPSTQRWSS